MVHSGQRRPIRSAERTGDPTPSRAIGPGVGPGIAGVGGGRWSACGAGVHAPPRAPRSGRRCQVASWRRTPQIQSRERSEARIGYGLARGAEAIDGGAKEEVAPLRQSCGLHQAVWTSGLSVVVRSRAAAVLKLPVLIRF